MIRDYLRSIIYKLFIYNFERISTKFWFCCVSLCPTLIVNIYHQKNYEFLQMIWKFNIFTSSIGTWFDFIDCLFPFLLTFKFYDCRKRWMKARVVWNFSLFSSCIINLCLFMFLDTYCHWLSFIFYNVCFNSSLFLTLLYFFISMFMIVKLLSCWAKGKWIKCLF